VCDSVANTSQCDALDGMVVYGSGLHCGIKTDCCIDGEQFEATHSSCCYARGGISALCSALADGGGDRAVPPPATTTTGGTDVTALVSVATVNQHLLIAILVFTVCICIGVTRAGVCARRRKRNATFAGNQVTNRSAQQQSRWHAA